MTGTRRAFAVALVTIGLSTAAFAAGPDSSSRVLVDWTHLPLSFATDRPGYATQEATVLEAVLRRIEAEPGDRRPTVVWFHRTSTPASERPLRTVPPGDEPSAIALGRFRSLRVDVDALRNEENRRAWAETPAFLFLDPAGTEIARVAGRRAGEGEAFEDALDRAWRASFATFRSHFVRAMRDVLDGKDAIADHRAAFERRRAGLGDEPPARELRELEREARAIERELEEVLAAERAALASVAIREEFRTDDGEPR